MPPVIVADQLSNADPPRLAVHRNPLSGQAQTGSRTRVASGPALLGAPALLILDDPPTGLAARQLIEMRGQIRSLAGERAVVVPSHILGEAERVADREGILLTGRLL